MRLWRPLGPAELRLIEQTGWRKFPPRLPEQPIFYPVTNFAYAEQIARDWNSVRDDSERSGYVVEFDVDDAIATKYPEQTVGAAARHRELWVPAEELDVFNSAILSPITVVATYRDGVRVEN